MALYVNDEPLNKDNELQDINGKKMKAFDIFAQAIALMTTEVMNTLNGVSMSQHQANGLELKSETDIHWVLPVPAIWNDLAKTFMRKTANKAGIPDQMLTIALEPEVASLYCLETLGIEKMSSGHRFMLLDLGGGTADITIHEVNADRTLSELHQPTGGDFGGTKVDNEFVSVLVKIFGAPLYQKFKRNHMDKYISLLQEFETKKQTFDGSRRMALQCPLELGKMYLEDVDQTFQSALHDTPFEDKIICIADKFIIVEELTKSFFDNTIEQIVMTAENLLRKVPNINSIILVGGFSESPYLQSVMRNRFGDMITAPLEPSQAVLNGAAVFGHKPLAIAERVCKYTYGIGRMMKFKLHHPAQRKVNIDGVDYCDGIFNKHIEVETKIRVAEDAEKAAVHKYFPTTTNMKQAVLDVYASRFKDPMFVDDHGCRLVGLIKLDIDSHGDIYSELLVKMMFGGTELQVQVTDVKNNKITNASFDFLGCCMLACQYRLFESVRLNITRRNDYFIGCRINIHICQKQAYTCGPLRYVCRMIHINRI